VCRTKSEVEDSIADFGLSGIRKCDSAVDNIVLPIAPMVPLNCLLTMANDIRLCDVGPKNPKIIQKNSGFKSSSRCGGVNFSVSDCCLTCFGSGSQFSRGALSNEKPVSSSRLFLPAITFFFHYRCFDCAYFSELRFYVP